jgi:hypothetical protein
MSSRVPAFLVGILSGAALYTYTSREIDSITRHYERHVALLGYRLHLLRAATGMPVEKGGVILPRHDTVAYQHPRPPVPPIDDEFYRAIKATAIHNWNLCVRKAHKFLMDALVEGAQGPGQGQQQDLQTQPSTATATSTASSTWTKTQTDRQR